MTSVCDTVSETISAVSTQAQITKAMTIERGVSTDSMSQVIAALFSDPVDISDAATQAFASMISEAIDATTDHAQTLSAVNLVSDSATIGTVISSGYVVTISDSVDVTDAQQVGLSCDTIESVGVATSVVAPLSATTLVFDVVDITDFCPPFMTNYVIESVDVSDSVSHLNTASAEVVDTIDATDAFAALATYTQHVTDAINATESVTTTLSAVNAVVDEAFAQDQVTGPAGAGWTAHAGTWGMSRYTNMPFNAVASIGGVLVLTSDDGFYTMNADNDGSSEVDASIDLGKSEGKGGYLRRPREIYIGYSGGRLSAVVAGAVNGAEAEHTYPFPVQTASTDTAAKVEPGRGLRSRYFRFGFENQNGARFSLRDARIIFDDTSRRV